MLSAIIEGVASRISSSTISSIEEKVNVAVSSLSPSVIATIEEAAKELKTTFCDRFFAQKDLEKVGTEWDRWIASVQRTWDTLILATHRALQSERDPEVLKKLSLATTEFLQEKTNHISAHLGESMAASFERSCAIAYSADFIQLNNLERFGKGAAREPFQAGRLVAARTNFLMSMLLAFVALPKDGGALSERHAQFAIQQMRSAAEVYYSATEIIVGQVIPVWRVAGAEDIKFVTRAMQQGARQDFAIGSAPIEIIAGSNWYVLYGKTMSGDFDSLTGRPVPAGSYYPATWNGATFQALTHSGEYRSKFYLVADDGQTWRVRGLGQTPEKVVKLDLEILGVKRLGSLPNTFTDS